MILRPLPRPQTTLQALVKPCLSSLRHQRRHKHNTPELPLGETFLKHGVPGFLSKEAYLETYVKYHQHLCAQLNEWTQGTIDESTGVKALHEKYARTSSHAALYNHAAMAHHTHFFWVMLTDRQTHPSHAFRRDIEENFDDLAHLRAEMLEAADAMFGNGFVWLMKDMSAANTLRILCTYNAGSPMPEAHQRRQDTDLATTTTSSSMAMRSDMAERMLRPQNEVGFIGEYSANRVRNYQNALLAKPILCVNVWQHQYLADYGVLGKREYLSAWWERINWDRVLWEYGHVPTGQGRSSSSLGETVSRSMNRDLYL